MRTSKPAPSAVPSIVIAGRSVRVVPDNWEPGHLRIDPHERCDPRFAELNAAIARPPELPPQPAPVPRPREIKRRDLEKTAARMRAKNGARKTRRFVALSPEERRDTYIREKRTADAR